MDTRIKQDGTANKNFPPIKEWSTCTVQVRRGDECHVNTETGYCWHCDIPVSYTHLTLPTICSV